MHLALLRLFAIGALLWVAGCSDYNRRWRAAQTVAPVSEDGGAFAGSYAGTWSSTRYSGTSGKLWCIVTRQGPGVYLAEFRATWHGIFSSRHSVLLRLTDRDRAAGRPVAKFAGAAEIRMWIGSGNYRCTGTLTPQGMVADYDAEYDRGRFELTRVAAAAAQ